MLRRTRSVARTMGRTALIAGTATAVSGAVAARGQAPRAPETAAPAPSPPQAAQPNVAEDLTKLADLRDRGVLSDQEFASLKARLLGA